MSESAPAPTLLADKRGLVLGVSSEDSVGFHTAKDLRAHGAELAVTARPGRAALLSRLVATKFGLSNGDAGALAEAIERAVTALSEMMPEAADE